MIVRYLPLLLVVSGLVLALAPFEAAAQEFGSGIRTDGTPSDRMAHDGVIKTKRKAATVAVGDVQPARAAPPDRIERTPSARTPQAPSRGGIHTPDPNAAPSKNDPRGVEERKDPEP